jgi:hypothetical protein
VNMLGAHFQELRELGIGGTCFRILWELKLALGLPERFHSPVSKCSTEVLRAAVEKDAGRKLFSHPFGVRDLMAPQIDPNTLKQLGSTAQSAVEGKIVCFSRWMADFGKPIDWYLHPPTGKHWTSGLRSSKALREGSQIGDVKLTWEVGRFPHSYLFARAATYEPRLGTALFAAFESQVTSFVKEAPPGQGIHWSSSQEVVFRLMAWIFAASVFSNLGFSSAVLGESILSSIADAAHHIIANFAYAKHAVYNNHLISEALGLYLAGVLLATHPDATGWRSLGRSTLIEEAGRQVYADGGYIQNSHNYHRLVLQNYLWYWRIAQSEGEEISQEIRSALERSVDFLWSHQDPVSGQLPNYGFNDGALPSLWTSCDFSDFRPTLQAANIAARGERLYPPGPWDEEAAWLWGPQITKVPLRMDRRTSRTFATSGYTVLRGREESTFAAFRCGSILDRFSQIDMLHCDVWWKGANVLIDGGSYLYNGPAEWHQHFYRTASHNTVVLDGLDQMLHLRKFKSVYWTKATTKRFENHTDWVLADGEHQGYLRQPGAVSHRRQVLFVKDSVWIVVDTLSGSGKHAGRIHWLGGLFPFRFENSTRLTLATPAGDFAIECFDDQGRAIPGSVIAGESHPPRGWVSRYYGEKLPVPSLVVEKVDTLPMTVVSVLGPKVEAVSVDRSRWSVRGNGSVTIFDIDAGVLSFVAQEVRS